MSLFSLIHINIHKVLHINKAILHRVYSWYVYARVNVYEYDQVWCELVRSCICAQKMIFQKNTILSPLLPNTHTYTHRTLNVSYPR